MSFHRDGKRPGKGVNVESDSRHAKARRSSLDRASALAPVGLRVETGDGHMADEGLRHSHTGVFKPGFFPRQSGHFINWFNGRGSVSSVGPFACGERRPSTHQTSLIAAHIPKMWVIAEPQRLMIDTGAFYRRYTHRVQNHDQGKSDMIEMAGNAYNDVFPFMELSSSSTARVNLTVFEILAA
ncbi:hypothetical protein BDZ45DRAFT_751587 [Acephala macrosclerotiorum]|nr:hypothetical protein BDZ45DRAFT_751587 [Acephala macrosclerotiorum]